MPPIAGTALLLLASLTPVEPQATQPPLPAAQAKKLRESFTDAFASSEPKDWKACLALARSLEEKHGRAAVLALLAAGPVREKGLPKARKVGKKKEELEEFGSVRSGYAFEHDGDVYRYCIDVPHDYDGEDPFALLVDPGHGSGAEQDARGKADFLPFFRGQVESAGLERWLVARTEIVEQVGAGGKLGAKPEDEVAAIFAAFRRDVLARFAVDPTRVYAAGLSQTGFWSWYLGRELADRLAGIAPMGAVTWGVDPALENLLHLPAYVIHGADDRICAVAQPRATTARLRELGAPVEFLELAGKGHDVGTWSRLGDGLAWLAARTPERLPRRVVKVLGTSANPWAWWVRVDALEKTSDGRAASAPTARVDARADGQRIDVESQGARKLSLWLPAGLVDLDQELVVVWNGAEAFRGTGERRAAIACEAALERADWTFLPEVRIELD